MKLNDPRITLIAGLALALNLNGSSHVYGAGPAPGKNIVLARAQLAPTPIAPQPSVPSLSPTPLSPIPTPVQVNPAPPPADASEVTTAPMPLGSQPALAPVTRPPMGLLYGEQERLDAMNMDPAIRPLLPQQVPGTLPSTSQFVPHFNDTPGIVVDRFGFAPPPGTLGQTYRRRSRPIEVTKHPRIGAVEVHLPEEVDVTAEGLKVKWTGKVWRLESDSLIPGIPHIYEVKASWGEGTVPQVRTIRLIMGRIVDLEF